MKTQTDKTTPGEWIVTENGTGRVAILGDKGAKTILSIPQPNQEDKNNAQLIVRAVNEYEVLCEIVEAAETFARERGIEGHVSVCKCDGCILRAALIKLDAMRQNGPAVSTKKYVILSTYRKAYFIGIHGHTPFYGAKEKAKSFTTATAATSFARAELFDSDVAFEIESVCPTCGGGHPTGCCAQDGHGG